MDINGLIFCSAFFYRDPVGSDTVVWLTPPFGFISCSVQPIMKREVMKMITAE